MSAMSQKMAGDARRGHSQASFVPFLNTNGKREEIVIPSPKRSAKLVQRMRAYGFTFKARPAQWVRFTDQPLQGTVWSGQQWLELAEKCHREAYGEEYLSGAAAPVKSPVKKRAKKAVKVVGSFLQRDAETGLIRETSTLYNDTKLFTKV